MILRRPYAFLIKNFKKIHFILFIAMIYIIYASNKILSFFNAYDKKRQVIFNENLASQHVSILMFIVGILIIGITIFIYILMKQKNKPRKLYIWMFIYYVVLLMLFAINYNYLNTIQFEGLEPQTVRLIRDINFIFIVIQTVFSLLIFIRAVGFDIRKFNFGEDIEDLRIDVTDNEEFELTSGIDTDLVKRKYRKQKRELKYFYIENKRIIISILLITMLSVGFVYLFQTQIANKVYKENDNINLDNLYFKVNHSYITKLNYKGMDVSEKGYTYLILDLVLNNLDEKERKLYLDNLKIEINDNIYSTNVTRYEYFTDIGIGYINQYIPKNVNKSYIVVFKIKDEDLNKKTKLRYTDVVYYNKNKLSSKYKRIELAPQSLDKKTEFVKAELNKEIYYGLSLLKETTLKITNTEFNNKYEYNIGDIKSYIVEPLESNVILKISYEFDLDNSITYITTFKNMIERFGLLTYKIDDKTHTASYNDLTPNNYKGKDIYLSVNKKIVESSDIQLVITVRNKKYTHILTE